MRPGRLWLVAGLLAWALAGCWDASSPEHLMIPTLMGVDWRDGQYTVTMQAVAPALLSVGTSSGGGGGGGAQGVPPVWVVDGRGRSLLTAIRRADLNFPHPVTLSHLEVLVLGRSMLSDRPLQGLVDALLRSEFLVRTFWVFAAQGSAAAVARGTNPIGLYPAQVLIRSAERAAHGGYIWPERFGHWVQGLIDAPDPVTLLPVVSAAPARGPTPGTDYRFVGSDIVAGGRLVGRLSRAAMLRWVLLTPERPSVAPVRPLLAVTVGRGRDLLTVQERQVRYWWRPGRWTIRLRLLTTLDETDTTGQGFGDGTPPAGTLGRLVARREATRLLRFVAWTQRRRLDLWHLGRFVSARDPAWFRAARGHWLTDYEHLPVTVQVQITVENTGNLRATR
jgi:hypothetical protein